ncbi:MULTISPECIES: hypothetical protein [unclassified Sphingobacterium]|uniref:hypothetical protein n=1 Tax=unclassified Sphingobacterium TaxID=2609468 RepID=UPI0025FC84E6|nr:MULTISPECIES: hypothetical protein [unclassified Sphingobacterium]
MDASRRKIEKIIGRVCATCEGISLGDVLQTATTAALVKSVSFATSTLLAKLGKRR